MNIKISCTTIILSLTILSSCEKNTDNELQKYKMEYIVNLNGDSDVYYMSVHTSTTFPEENETAWIGRSKSDEELSNYDSIYISPEIKVYSGCTRYMMVRLYFNDIPDFYKYRDYVFDNDTIISENDVKLIFNWPEDSAKIEYSEHIYPKN